MKRFYERLSEGAQAQFRQEYLYVASQVEALKSVPPDQRMPWAFEKFSSNHPYWSPASDRLRDHDDAEIENSVFESFALETRDPSRSDAWRALQVYNKATVSSYGAFQGAQQSNYSEGQAPSVIEEARKASAIFVYDQMARDPIFRDQIQENVRADLMAYREHLHSIEAESARALGETLPPPLPSMESSPASSFERIMQQLDRRRGELEDKRVSSPANNAEMRAPATPTNGSPRDDITRDGSLAQDWASPSLRANIDLSKRLLRNGFGQEFRDDLVKRYPQLEEELRRDAETQPDGARERRSERGI